MKFLRLSALFISAATLFILVGGACPCAHAGSASASFERLEGLFLQGQYGAVVSESDAVARSGYGRRDEVYYLKGLSQLKMKRFADARESFGCIESGPSRSKRLFDARLGIGDSYILEGNLNAAAGVYNRMTDEFRSNKNLPEVYARLASCYEGLGLRDKASTYEAMARNSSAYGFGVKIRASPLPQANARPTAYGASSSRISVQAGSFKSRENASKFARELAAAGYESRVEVPIGQYDRLYRVKVGRPASKDEAEAIAARLRNDGYKTAICSDDV